jgi:hypothetical protein
MMPRLSALSFRGRLHPLAYAVAAPALLLAQNAAVAGAYALAGQPLEADLQFWLLPLRSLATLAGVTPSALAGAFATTAGQGYGVALLTVIPALQLAAVLVLIVLPQTGGGDEAEPEAGGHKPAIVQGVLAGVALVVFGVALSALVFGAYGYGMFMLTPLLVGVTTGYIANRKVMLTLGRTISLAMSAMVLSGLALLLLALEGVVCILMAAPLAAAMAALGAAIGWSLLPKSRRPARPMAMSFRLGLAYPVRGEMKGEGVGAERIGVFSTGEARERITAWAPGEKLEFVVLSNPPLMDEYSPYPHVHAPHVNGYFETGWTRFDLQPLPGGRTRLVVTATHTLRLDPVLYWAPMVRWGIDQNNARVLRHIRTTAETMDRSSERASAGLQLKVRSRQVSED